VSGKQLLDLTPEFDALDTERVEKAVAVEVAHRTERYLAGLDAYRRHPYRRHSASPPIVWHDGTTQLLDYHPRRRGTDGTGRALAD
jgi:polyhydroxyalkanoate synthase